MTLNEEAIKVSGRFKIKYFKYVIVFLLVFFTIDAGAGMYSGGNVTKSASRLDKLFAIDFLKNNSLLSAFNILYLIPFSFWVRKQSITQEILLYQIRGKYTFFNIKLWIERVENERGTRLNGTRKRIGKIVRNAQKVNARLSLWKKHIDKQILKSAYKGSFKRMHKNTRLLIYGQLAQVVISTILSIKFWLGVLRDEVAAFFLGFCTAFFIGVVYWMVSNLIFGLIFRLVVKSIVSIKGHAGYWHVISGQMRGFYGGFWPKVEIPQKALMAISDIEIEEGSTKVVFKDFKGGGAKGNW